MSDNLNSAEERALDVLLSEIHGGNRPPDFTREIISHLNRQPSADSTLVTPVAKTSARRGSRRDSARWMWAPALIAIAASLLLAFWYGRSPDPTIAVAPAVAQTQQAQIPQVSPSTTTDPSDNPKPTPAASLPSVSPEAEIADSGPSNRAMPEADELSPKHDFEPSNANSRRGVTLAGDPKSRVMSELDAATNDQAPTRRPQKPTVSRQSISLVSKQVDEGLQRYWRSIDVQPTHAISTANVVRRVESALGVKVAEEAISNVGRLRNQLMRPAAAESIASHWMDSLTLNAFRRADEIDRKKVLNVLAEPIAAGKGFDQALVALIAGRSDSSESWYNALGSHGEAALRNRVASISMNADLRCTRCHDALVASKGRQQDYWSFAALLKSMVKSQENGRWRLQRSGDGAAPNPIFYDMADGRRRIAQPAVPQSWLGPEWTESPASLDVWAEDLIGSRPLAKGIVNSMWKTLFGRPLVSPVVDLSASPRNEDLLRLEQELSDDLIASNFDVARTLALMIQSDAMRRSVPDVLAPDKTLLASRDQVSSANKLVMAFAAAPPKRPNVPINRRIAHVLRASGSSIELALDGGPAILSQAGVTQPGAKQAGAKQGDRMPKKQRSTKSVLETTPTDFPADADAVPVQWLNSISDADIKIDHLAYLSGRSRLPANAATAVDAMRQAETDESLMLQRVWWILSN
tara:strand:- start:78938 stop:81016 length:2079 start_codon:yes stop_codon:yes gene_type:complete